VECGEERWVIDDPSHDPLKTSSAFDLNIRKSSRQKGGCSHTLSLPMRAKPSAVSTVVVYYNAFPDNLMAKKDERVMASGKVNFETSFKEPPLSIRS